MELAVSRVSGAEVKVTEHQSREGKKKEQQRHKKEFGESEVCSRAEKRNQSG